MKKQLLLLIWMAFYTIVIWTIFVEIKESNVPIDRTNVFLDLSLFKVQKFLYNSTIFFTLFLFIHKVPLNSPMLITRCKENYSWYILNNGLKLSGGYVLVTGIIHIIIPMINGIYIHFNYDVVINFAKLFLFVLFMYLVFVNIYLKSNKYILALLSLFVINSTILIIYFAVSFGLGNPGILKIELELLTLFSSFINVILIIRVLFMGKYREYV